MALDIQELEDALAANLKSGVHEIEVSPNRNRVKNIDPLRRLEAIREIEADQEEGFYKTKFRDAT
jgi:hypothetical protein